MTAAGGLAGSSFLHSRLVRRGTQVGCRCTSKPVQTFAACKQDSFHFLQLLGCFIEKTVEPCTTFLRRLCTLGWTRQILARQLTGSQTDFGSLLHFGIARLSRESCSLFTCSSLFESSQRLGHIYRPGFVCYCCVLFSDTLPRGLRLLTGVWRLRGLQGCGHLVFESTAD